MTTTSDEGGRVTEREYLEAQIASLRELVNERDRLYSIQFTNQGTAVSAALAAQEKGTAAAFLASEKAIQKAEDAQRDYNARSNEFRGQLDDQAKTLMARSESLSMHGATSEKIGLLQKGVDDKLAALAEQFEAKLEGQRRSNEKFGDSVSKEIAGLRESRSEGAGRGVATTDQRAAYIAIAFLVVAVLGLALQLTR